jgi:hypothetical protein
MLEVAQMEHAPRSRELESTRPHGLRQRLAWTSAVGLAFVGLIWLASGHPRAAESAGSSRMASESAGMLGDLYAWENDGKITLVLTYAQGIEAGGEPVYDPDLLYSIWLHVAPDWELPHRMILVRFGHHEQTGEWGVQLRHVPGAGEDLVGPVEQTLEAGTARAWVGLRDDPFFFDVEGLEESIATQSLAFDPARDAYAGTNAMAIVIEFPKQAIVDSADPIAFHAAVGRAR